MSNDQNAPGDGWEIEDDLDKVETRKEAQVGRYLCRVASMEKKPTKDGSKDFFNLAFEIIDCMAPETEPSIGSRVFDIFNINQVALWKLKALISACGFDATGSRVPNLVDCEVVLDTFEDTYEGRTNLKTKRYKNPSEGWSGLHETRDASEPAAKNIANQPEKPAALTSKGTAASAGALKGKSVSTAKKTGSKPDDEVEI